MGVMIPWCDFPVLEQTEFVLLGRPLTLALDLFELLFEAGSRPVMEYLFDSGDRSTFHRIKYPKTVREALEPMTRVRRSIWVSLSLSHTRTQQHTQTHTHTHTHTPLMHTCMYKPNIHMQTPTYFTHTLHGSMFRLVHIECPMGARFAGAVHSPCSEYLQRREN